MAEPSNLTPNQEEVMEENVQPSEENRQEETTGEMHAEASEIPTVPEKRPDKGKGKVTEEEGNDFVSEEAHSNMWKHYAYKGFVAERRFKNPITPFKELIAKRGWETLCAHRRAGYVAVVREFYANLVGRKDNTVYVRGVWVPNGAQAINQVYGLAGLKHGSKFKKLLENPDLKKIAEKLTGGKAQLRQEKGGPKTLNRGSLTEEAKVWFYFLSSVLVPTKHLSTVREQEAVMLYAILKGYKINIGAIIENSIMRYHDGNKRGLIPHPATVTILCLKAGVKGDWGTEEEVPLASPLVLTGVTKGPRNQKKKGVLIKTGEEAPTAGPEKENLENPMGENTFPRASNEGHDEGLPMDFSFPLASSPPRQSRTFGEQGESSREANENQGIMELLLTIQRKLEEREKRWNIQQQFRENTYEAELKRRDQQLEEELQRKEEKFEAELQRREQKFEKELQRRENRFEAESRRREQEWEKKLKGKEDQVKEVLKQQGEDFKREMKERDRDLMQELKLSHEAFYNNQFIRDSQLLTLIKEKELEKDTRWGEQLNGIKGVCKVLEKEFEKKLDERDKNQRDTDSYRQKEWLENLDLINNNLSKFLEVMTEMEVKMNNLGKRQDQLNEKVDLSNEIFIEEQAEKESQKRKERMEMKFPPFPDYLDTIDLDPPDIYSSKQKKRKK